MLKKIAEAKGAEFGYSQPLQSFVICCLVYEFSLEGSSQVQSSRHIFLFEEKPTNQPLFYTTFSPILDLE